MSKCPYCYRTLGTFLKDPIVIPNGSKYKWSNSNETILIEETDIEKRKYRGLYQIFYEEVEEIQDFLKDLEEENLPVEDRTDFSSINNGGIFQFTGKHLKEMRDSVDKLLIALGMTKTEYFNYDEEGNHITHPNGNKTEWTDPITLATDLQKFQIKYIHIEDLRHYLSIFKFRENWEFSPEGTYTPGNSFAGQDSKGWYVDGLGIPIIQRGYGIISSVRDLQLVSSATPSSDFNIYWEVIGGVSEYSANLDSNLLFTINQINIPVGSTGQILLTFFRFPPTSVVYGLYTFNDTIGTGKKSFNIYNDIILVADKSIFLAGIEAGCSWLLGRFAISLHTPDTNRCSVTIDNIGTT